MSRAEFLDGPARGVTLSLERAPIMLRVVRSSRGFDALDQPTDAPRPDERVTVYVMASQPVFVHVDYRGPGGRRCGRSETWAKYRALPEQPSELLVRDREAWIHWCEANKPALMAAHRAFLDNGQ